MERKNRIDHYKIQSVLLWFGICFLLQILLLLMQEFQYDGEHYQPLLYLFGKKYGKNAFYATSETMMFLTQLTYCIMVIRRIAKKREENALAKSMTVPVARIIDDPDSTGEPVSPKKILLLCAAVLLGVLLPAFVIYLRMLLFPVLKDKKMLERLTSIPVLAEISKKPGNKFFVVEKKSVEPIAELFRLLRNNLQFVLTGPEKKVIAVTSSVMHEGKTFVSCNMALSFALTGKRVLLIGVDIRRPRLAQHFQMSNMRGVTTYLSGGDSDLSALIQSSGIDSNLDVLPAGPVPPNPNELLMSSRFEQLVDYARSHYDYVILDNVPAQVGADATIVNRVAELTLYVVRDGKLDRRYLPELERLHQEGKFKHLCIVLNDSHIEKKKYGYGYGYGYGQDEKKKKKKE